MCTLHIQLCSLHPDRTRMARLTIAIKNADEQGCVACGDLKHTTWLFRVRPDGLREWLGAGAKQANGTRLLRCHTVTKKLPEWANAQRWAEGGVILAGVGPLVATAPAATNSGGALSGSALGGGGLGGGGLGGGVLGSSALGGGGLGSSALGGGGLGGSALAVVILSPKPGLPIVPVAPAGGGAGARLASPGRRRHREPPASLGLIAGVDSIPRPMGAAPPGAPLCRSMAQRRQGAGVVTTYDNPLPGVTFAPTGTGPIWHQPLDSVAEHEVGAPAADIEMLDLQFGASAAASPSPSVWSFGPLGQPGSGAFSFHSCSPSPSSFCAPNVAAGANIADANIAGANIADANIAGANIYVNMPPQTPIMPSEITEKLDKLQRSVDTMEEQRSQGQQELVTKLGAVEDSAVSAIGASETKITGAIATSEANIKVAISAEAQSLKDDFAAKAATAKELQRGLGDAIGNAFGVFAQTTTATAEATMAGLAANQALTQQVLEAVTGPAQAQVQDTAPVSDRCRRAAGPSLWRAARPRRLTSPRPRQLTRRTAWPSLPCPHPRRAMRPRQEAPSASGRAQGRDLLCATLKRALSTFAAPGRLDRTPERIAFAETEVAAAEVAAAEAAEDAGAKMMARR